MVANAPAYPPYIQNSQAIYQQADPQSMKQAPPFDFTMGGQEQGQQGLNTGGYPGSSLMDQGVGSSQNYQATAPVNDYSQLGQSPQYSPYQTAYDPYADPATASNAMSYLSQQDQQQLGLSPAEQQLLSPQAQQGLSGYPSDTMGGGSSDYSQAVAQGNWTNPSAATGQFTQGQSFNQSGQSGLYGAGQQDIYGAQTQDPNAVYSTRGYGTDPSSYMASYGAGQGGQQAGSGMSFTG